MEDFCTLKVGHLALQCDAELCEQWQDVGGKLAAQALSPLAAVDPSKTKNLCLLATGPGSAIAGVIGVQLGFKQIDLVLHPDDAALFAKFDKDARANIFDRIEKVPPGRNYHRILLGCDAKAPEVGQGRDLVQRLKREGQFVLFGLPRKELNPTFALFSKHGLSLRACGLEGDFGFLSGSLVH